MLIEKFDEIEKLDKAIDKALTQMSGINPDAPEYAKMADQLTKLMKIKEIIAILKLKAFEAVNKKEETDSNLKLKEIDTLSKQKETETNCTLKMDDSVDKREELESNLKLKAVEIALKHKDLETPDRVSKDTLAIIAGNIAGIVLIIGYERMNVIASKALGFVMKSR